MGANRPELEAGIANRSHGVVNEEPITDANGVAELELPAGTLYEIHLRHDGEHLLAAKQSLESALTALEVRELVIPLRTKPDVRMCGRVIDDEAVWRLPGDPARWLHRRYRKRIEVDAQAMNALFHRSDGQSIAQDSHLRRHRDAAAMRNHR